MATKKSIGTKGPMPARISPMLCTLTKEPVDDPDYVYEIKWDGYRIISYVDATKVRMDSRSSLDYTKKYPPIATALKKLKHRVVLDGEVVVFNEAGHPDFDALQLYNGHNTPISYCVFDILWLDGFDLKGLPKWTDIMRVDIFIKQKDALSAYIKDFNSIELNATHYKIYEEAWVTKWADKAVGTDFLFCPKMYKGITHYGTLNKELMITEFLKGISIFNDNLGPVLIQLKEAHSPERKEELFKFLRSLPKNFQFFLEVRHPGWFNFNNGRMHEELISVLAETSIGAVITDAPGRRDVMHMDFPIPKLYVRFVCKGNSELDYLRIDEWKSQLKHLISKGLTEIHFFLHVHDDDHVMDFARHVQKEFFAIIPTLL